MAKNIDPYQFLVVNTYINCMFSKKTWLKKIRKIDLGIMKYS